jgi:GMP synthase (glutamine-hydrolysing)
MEARVVLIRHSDSPADDRVVSFLRMCGVEPEFRHPFKGEPLESPDESVAAGVLYGGPFNVFETERHPFLKDEHRWAEGCMKRGIPLLGICQGTQEPAEQDRLRALHDARQHDWFMGFLERFLGQRLPAAALSA